MLPSCSVGASETYYIVVALLLDPLAPSSSALVIVKRTKL